MKGGCTPIPTAVTLAVDPILADNENKVRDYMTESQLRTLEVQRLQNSFDLCMAQHRIYMLTAESSNLLTVRDENLKKAQKILDEAGAVQTGLVKLARSLGA